MQWLGSLPLRSRGFTAPNAVEFKRYWDKKVWTDQYMMSIYILTDIFKVYLHELPEIQHRQVFFAECPHTDNLITDINGVIEFINARYSQTFKFI